MLEFICNVDGGSRGNPGEAAIGIYIRDVYGNSKLSYGECIGVATNNVAEYTALEKGLTLLKECGVKKVSIRMDSLLVVNQVNGFWKIKDPTLKSINMRVNKLIEFFDEISITHVVRKFNKEADALVNEALDTKLIIKRTE